MQVPGDTSAPPRPKFGWWMVVAGLFFCCLLPWMIGNSIYSFFSGGKHLVQDQLCLNNLKAVADAQALYTVDNNGYLPPAPWMDSTLPYLKKNVGAIGCPSARNKRKEEYGYAMNERFVGKLMMMVSFSQPLVFDSTLLQRNAVGSTSTLPERGRHTKDDDDDNPIEHGNNVVFMDGSARWTDKREF